jgi:ATP-binding cassette subfamily F protein 3
MIILQGANLARRYGVEVIFENVQMTIQHNSRIALVGRNGAGKSTLLKMLANIEEPDDGQISLTKGTTIAYMDQHTAVSGDRTIYEEMVSVFEPVIKMLKESEEAAAALADEKLMQDPEAYQSALNRYDQLQEDLIRFNAYGYESEIRMVLHGFQFFDEDYDRKISTLSGGQRTRLALAKILLEKRDLLILDEPTNHLDIDTLTWLESYLPKYPGALLIVSHDRYFLDAVTNETYEMAHQGIDYYKGNYSFYLSERTQRLTLQMKAYEKQQEEIAKLEDYVARNLVRASTTKMAQSRRKQLEKMDKIKKPLQDEKSARIQFSVAEESGNDVLQTNQLAVGYSPDKILSEPISFQMRKQEAIAIVGPNGVGKSTLLKTIIKQIPAIKGTINYGAHLQIGYYDQELGNLNSRKDVLHELWDEHPTMMERDIRTILGSFLFTGNDVNKIVNSLSGGEKARLELAKLALEHDNFLILDEPTNHLDIDSKEVLENALIEYDGSLLFVSHDRYFINRVATSVLEISAEGSTLYLGDYDYYIAKKEAEAERLALLEAENASNQAKPSNDNTAAPSDNKQAFQMSKDKQREQRKLERQLNQYEEDLATIEADIEAIQVEMTKPEYLDDFTKLNDLNETLQAKQAEQERLMEAWEETSIALEEL